MQTTVLFALFFSALVAVSLSQTCTDSFTISIDNNVVFDLTNNGTIFGCPDSGGALQDICTSRLDTFDTQLRDYLLAKEFGCDIQCVKPIDLQNIRTEGTPAMDDVCYNDGVTSCNVTGSNVDEGVCNSAGACVPVVGCADGTREAYTNMATYPDIAACQGAWLGMIGVTKGPTSGACANNGGNTAPAVTTGASCSIGDLCSVGWHVCATIAEVAAAVPGGCKATDFTAGEFFATQVSGPGNMMCSGTASGTNINDIFGCGDVGSLNGGVAPDPLSCGALNDFGNDGCKSLDTTVWSCGPNPGTMEANMVMKSTGPGGALCCKN